jgi:hypothetical protein
MGILRSFNEAVEAVRLLLQLVIVSTSVFGSCKSRRFLKSDFGAMDRFPSALERLVAVWLVSLVNESCVGPFHRASSRLLEQIFVCAGCHDSQSVYP